MSENTPPPPPGDTPPPPPPGGYGGTPPPPGGYGGPPPPPGGYGGPPPPGGYGGYGGPPPPAGPGWSVGDAVGYGWKKFQANSGQILLAGLVVFVGLLIFEGIGVLVRNVLVSSPECTFTEAGGLTCTQGSGFIVSLFASMLMSFLFYVVYQAIGAGIVRGALGITEGRRFVVSEIFTTDKIVAILVTAVLTGLAIAIGTMLCFLPGLIAAFFLTFSMYFVLDKEMAPIEAMTASVNLVKDNLGEVLVWYLVSIALIIVGALVCLVGLIVAIPVVLIGNAFVYKKLTHQPVAA